VVPALNNLSNSLDETTKGLDQTIKSLEYQTAKARFELDQERKKQDEATSAVPQDLSRAEAFSAVPALVEKHRVGWIKVLGSPDRSSPPFHGVPPGGIDCWRRNDVDMIVTWLKDRRPLGIMFTASKGQPDLTAEEIKVLEQYFARFRPAPSETGGVLVIGINKEP
jgi:hypothetical protein